MNPTRVKKYQCQECNALHDHHYEAEDCCPPGVEDVSVWKCAECLDLHYDETEARHCCWDGESSLLPTPQDLEAAGQQRLPLELPAFGRSKINKNLEAP
jgi:hypothetical protein